MSDTNSRMVAVSMFSVCIMLSDSSLMDASGVLSSCDASDTNRRLRSSVSRSRSVMLLNSFASAETSSLPTTSIW